MAEDGTVLVVGGTGMLGRQMVTKLLSGGRPVRALVRPGSDIGNSNLAEAASRTNIRRFVLTSILTCDQTPDVPHFWHKKLAEDRLEELGVPFVALRPGAFLDQVTRFGGDPFSKGRLTWLGSSRTPLSFVLTADLAGYLAAAIDAPGSTGSASISVGPTGQPAGRR